MNCAEVKGEEFKKFETKIGDHDTALKMYIANDYAIPEDKKTQKTTRDYSIENKVYELRQQVDIIDGQLNEGTGDKKALLAQKEGYLKEIGTVQKRFAQNSITRQENRHLEDVNEAMEIINSDHPTIEQLDLIRAIHEQHIRNANLSDTMLLSDEQKKLAATNPKGKEGDIMARLGALAKISESVLDGLYVKGNEVFEEFANSKGYTLEQEKMNVIGGLRKSTMSLNEMGSKVAQLIADKQDVSVGEAHTRAVTATRILKTKYEEAEKSVGKKKLREMINGTVSNTDSRLTMNTPELFTYESNEKKTDAIEDYVDKVKAHRNTDLNYTEKGKLVQSETKEILTTLNKDYLFVNSELLKENTPEAKAHEKELRMILGDEYDERVKIAERKHEKYVASLDMKDEELSNQKASINEFVEELENWQKSNNPEEIIASINKPGVDQSRYMVNFDMVELIPRSKSAIDNRYLEIKKDRNVHEFYKELIALKKQMKTYLPLNESRFLDDTASPIIVNRALEELQRAGLPAFLNSVKTSHIEGISDKGGSTKTQTFKSGLRFMTENTVKDEVTGKVLIKEAELGRELTRNEYQSIERDVIHKIASKSTADIMNTMAHYIEAAMMTKYRMASAPFVKMAKFIVEQNPDIKDDKKLLAQVTEMMDNYMNVFYGNSNRIESNMKSKVLTPEEKKLRKEYLEAIKRLQKEPKSEKIALEVSNLELRISKLGGVRSYSKMGDRAMTLLGIKFLGYSIKGATYDYINGFKNLDDYAAMDIEFNTHDKNVALSYLLASQLKTASFGLLNGKLAKAITNMVELYSLVDVTASEMHRSRSFTKYNVVKAVAPMWIQKIKEFANQAPIGFAILEHQKVIYKGKKTSLFKAMCDNNGVIPATLTDEHGTPVYSDGSLGDLYATIQNTINNINGQYKSKVDPILAKNTIMGRVLLQFKGWMMKAIDQRFGEERADIHREAGVHRGRIWQTGYRYYKNEIEKANNDKYPVSTLRGIALGTAKIAYNSVIKTLHIVPVARGLQDKLYYIDSRTGEEYDQTDIENMKGNVAELSNILLASLSILALMKLKGTGDDDDDKKIDVLLESGDAINNQLIYFVDITSHNKKKDRYYIEPKVYESLQRICPIIGATIGDSKKLIDACYDQYEGKYEEDAIPPIAKFILDESPYTYGIKRAGKIVIPVTENISDEIMSKNK